MGVEYCYGCRVPSRDGSAVVGPLVDERCGTAGGDREGGGLACRDGERRCRLGRDRGNGADGKRGGVADVGTGGVGYGAAELIAVHGDCADDPERGGGCTAVAAAVGEVSPSAAAGCLALPLVGIVAEGRVRVAYGDREWHRVSRGGCFVGWLAGE